MTGLDDQTLVQRALRADPESFGELCRRYYPALVAMADSILLDHHLAEDAAQEALAEACRGLKRLRRPESFGSWLGSICRNVAKDMLRQLPKQRNLGRDPPRQEPACEADYRAAALTEAVQQLPPHQREVIFMRFYNEMSYRQMAKVLGSTEQTIDGRLRRAKKSIAAYLRRKGLGSHGVL
ncbi:MAG: sigma-70 family RNA polymerase sigma factor [Phycisphaerales bacterium]|nr:MAG: sigma-70 family RNA polymerase sigma factor [Phycisphaerales bacterium]